MFSNAPRRLPPGFDQPMPSMAQLMTPHAPARGQNLGRTILQPLPAIANSKAAAKSVSSESSEDGVTIQDIIADKPSVAIVREFFKQNLDDIKSPEQYLFD